MKLQDLLRHIADNIESGRKSFAGLDHPFVADPHEKLFLYPEEFELAPRTHEVNGFTVPAPETEMTEKSGDYYCCSLLSMEWYVSAHWTNSKDDFAFLKRGIIHLTKEAAIANARAMRGFNPYPEAEK